MSSILLTLPLQAPEAGAAAPEFDYLLSDDLRSVQAQGRAAAALLPAQSAREGERVLILPANAVCWHRVFLPVQVGRSALAGRLDASRLRAVFSGILEEQMLDEPQRLHFAFFSAEDDSDKAGDAQDNREGRMPLWVATCDRAWLQRGLQALEGASQPVSRIVAQYTPLSGDAHFGTADGTAEQGQADSQGQVQVHILAAARGTQIIVRSARGVAVLPLLPQSVSYAREQGHLQLTAEPSVLAEAEQAFGQRVALQTPAEVLLQASQSGWNLAQGEFSPSRRGHLIRRLSAAWKQFLKAPAWRPVRWGLVCFALVQLVAVNALAWRQQNLLDQRRAAARAILTQTFPEIAVVVDAPLQMRRALDALALDRGVAGGPDVAQVLSLIGTLAESGQPDAIQAIDAIDVDDGVIRLHTGPMAPAEVTRITTALAARNWQTRFQDGTLTVQQGGAD